jgi:hypothetical protein
VDARVWRVDAGRFRLAVGASSAEHDLVSRVVELPARRWAV